MYVFNLLIRFIYANDMLNKVSFSFVCTLSVATSLLVMKLCFCLAVPELFFFRKNFCSPPDFLLSVSYRPYQQGFCFFLPLSQNILTVSFFNLTDLISCFLNFLPKKFLSCCWSKSTFSLNILWIIVEHNLTRKEWYVIFG